MSRRRGPPPSRGGSSLRHRPARAVGNAVWVSIFLSLLPLASSAFWQWNADGASPRKVKPRITRPSGPTNVTLHVVSRTELGVAWEPPLHDGGKAITKYLVEWDTDRYMTSGIASPSNPYGGSDGPLARSEVVSGDTEFRIAGLDEGQEYYVRVSAYGEGYSNAISTDPPSARPAGMLPGYLTDVSLAVATDSDAADRLRLAWSAAEVDVNGFGVLPTGCGGGASPPSAPDSIDAYRVMWDTHPSLSNAQVYDVPAVTGDGSPLHCCPSDSGEGTCVVELGAEAQSVRIKFPQSSVSSGGDLFDSGAVRLAYVGSQSKSIKVMTPTPGSTQVLVSPGTSLPSTSPIDVGDLIRIQDDVYLVSNVDGWPLSIDISSEYVASESATQPEETVQAYFASPPGSCFDASSTGNSAESFRAHIAMNFDDSPFDESVVVSRSTLEEPFSNDDSNDTRIVGYEYQVTFSGQGFSSTLGGPVEELLVISDPSSPFYSVGDCGAPFVSSGVDVSSQVSVEVSTDIESVSITPGTKYYVQIAGINTNGVGPFVPADPEGEIPRSQPGLAQNCRVYAIPTESSSLKVEWDGVHPGHGQAPLSYRVDFYDADDVSSDPVATHVVSDIDESSRYSITKDDLIPGKKYKVLIVPTNELGEGAPSWFGDFNPVGLINDDRYAIPQDYLEQACHAVPTCESGSVQCAEIDAASFAVVARSVPPPPRVEVGTYPSVSTKNRFSQDSLLVTFESPMSNGAGSNGVPTDKFLVEWSTSPSFLPSTYDGVDTLWSSEVPALYSDQDGEDAMGELLIDSLAMGIEYFVRVSAHNSAGYGPPTNSVPAKPMTRPDPPFEPVLSSLTHDYLEASYPESSLSDSALVGTSLLVSWKPPRVDASNDRPDLVGDGGDEVSSYLVEWSRMSWDSFTSTELEIKLQTASGLEGSDALGLLSGSFQLVVDTTMSSSAVVSGSYASAVIPVDASPQQLKTIVENVPNVGEVDVSSPEPLSWRITFLSEVGDLDVALAENNIVDDGLVAGTIGITKLNVGTIPANSAFGFEIISDLNALTTVAGTMHYAINHLVPGMKVFVRISAGNQVGFGPRRKTAPEFSSPALQRPDVPTSLHNDGVPPYLSVHSPTALKVHAGPPFYDGGSPLTSFLIEWDASPTFSSSALGDGSPLGSVRVDAASQVCASCVSDFALATNTFTYSGSEDTAQLLVPQRKISVYFHDDNESYTFTVVSATTTTIAVDSNHLRVSSLGSMQDHDGGLGSNLDILGATFVIDGLDTDRAYFVRVSSENGEMGTGKAVATMPLKATPRGFPLPPSSASVSVVNKNALSVSWSSDAHPNDPTIQAYKIERFCKSHAASGSSFSFFGEQEVVEFSTVGLGLVGGTFHLYFGELDAPTNVVLGTARATAGLDYVETQVDLTPLLHRGEAILIGDSPYFVHGTEPFTSGRLPLSSTYSGSDEEAVSVFVRPKSMPIAFDATAAEVRNALEQMPNVNHVEVRRETDDALDGYLWSVTFETNKGPQPAFSVDTANLVGSNPIGFAITRSVTGVVPDDYDVSVVQDPTATSFVLDNLETGKPYYVQVSSISGKGESLPIDTHPSSIAPGGVPGDISPPSIRPLDESTLLVSFEAAAEANGAPVNEFVVETSSEPSFANSLRTTVQPVHKVQRVTTRAHTLPWDVSSSFTLSLGDFHGDFTVAVGDGTTTVRVQNGDNVLERSTGTTSLSSAVARGDFLSVGGVEFRVCLSDSHVHDDAHLSLCSKDDPLKVANFVADDALDIIDELPIFILDTSLAAAKSPSVGDSFLSTVDASGSSIDSRGRLRRGDLIRVGHPVLGETFRVSTDSARDFTDRVIPLGAEDDSDAPASLSSESLEHATYEVQSFSIRASSDAVSLTPSTTLSSGYRIRFKLETTQGTVAGGAGGCLAWDGDADDLKRELETLSGIDSIEVAREDLPAVPGGVGAGVKYSVTFTGTNVRGNVPPIQILDVGSNGCLDASSLGGTFGGDVAPISVAQVEAPYVPFYTVQTTADIPYDASSAEKKTTLQALSQACSVDVSREINRHGHSWDITFTQGGEEDSYAQLLPISANGANLAAHVDPGIRVVDILNVQVPTDTGGTPVFARVAAVNSFGMGPFTLSNPRAVEVSPQPPSEPVQVFAEAISDAEILVQWNPPLQNGGRPVTHYKIEYDESSTFTSGSNGGARGSISVSSSAASSVADVQSVTVKIDNEGQAYLSGTFSLIFDGQKTGQLPYDASPEEVKSALEELCNVQEVRVTRSIHCSPDPSIGCMSPDGYTWLISFIDPLYSSYHELSVSASSLFHCSDVGRATCSIGGMAVATVGKFDEIQRITIGSSPFSVTIGGETSDIINIGDSVSGAEAKLINSYSKKGVGKIGVTCADCVGDVISTGDSLLLHFLSFRGDLPAITASDPAVVVSEITKGSSQFVVGRAPYSTVISGLSSVNDWHVRVFAYNGVGEGPPEHALPSPLRLATAPPQVPANVAATVGSSTSLQVSWDRPSSIGGAQLSSFVIEYDTSEAFATRTGTPLSRLTVTEAEADASIGIVSQSYPDSSDPVLRKRIVVDDVDVFSQGLIEVGSLLVIDGHYLTVSYINEDSCGVTCLTMNDDYTGANSSGMKIYPGSQPQHYSYPITNLIPGTEYFVRVAAVNEQATGPFAFPGYPFSPIALAPRDIPTAPSWASIVPVSKDELRVDFGPPLSSEKPYGINGSPHSKYHIEVALAEDFRPEVLSLSTSADVAVSGHIELSAGYQGDYDLLISVGSQPAQFIVGPGSRWVGCDVDLTSILHPGETILIGGEFVEVRGVSADEIELEEYHIRGTGQDAVPGYRMDNYIGSATLSPGDTSLISTQNLDSVLLPGETIQVKNGAGNNEYLTVTSVAGSSVNFSPSFPGGTATTPIYVKKKVIVSANSSSAAMKASIESLRDVGSVVVERDGPNSSEGYTWHISFMSNTGLSSCATPYWCFAASTQSVNYISVSGLGKDYDGTYVQTSFQEGRPRYELLGKSCYVFYDPASSEWRLYSGASSLMSSVASSDATVPLSGWSNGASMSLSSGGAAPLLLGQNAAAHVSTIQSGVEMTFAEQVYSADVGDMRLEVQEVELMSDEDDLRGSFELSLGAIPQTVTLYYDEMAEDFLTKLESLSGIGSVAVESAEPPSDKYGRVWRITFLSQLLDVPLLRHHGTANLIGTGVSLNVREHAKGNPGQHHIHVEGLAEGRTYAARVRAENSAGVGPYTATTSQVLSSSPGPPSLSTGIVTKARADIRITDPEENGSDISSYKVEWTSSSSFGSAPEATARVSCSDGSEVLGSIRFVYGHEGLSRSETSPPVDVRSDASEVSRVLNTFGLLNEIEVSINTNETSEVEWSTYLHSVGRIDAFSLDTELLRCQSEEPVVESTLTMSATEEIPADYHSSEIFTDDALCGNLRLGEFSDVQLLTLVASSEAVTGGSYKMTLDGETTECIPFDATGAQLKGALEGLDAVQAVEVTATPAPTDARFPTQYTITFKGHYAYGDWPALQVNPAHFGAKDCEDFVGGVDHRATVLPIRDETVCLDGADVTVAIVADSITAVGGTFSLSYADTSVDVPLGSSSSEMEDALSQLIGSEVHVTRYNHNDMGQGVAWAVTYPRSSNGAKLRTEGTHVTGRNAKVNVYPVLQIKTYSPFDDVSGEFRIVIDDESTSPLSIQASPETVLAELHKLDGLGKVVMLNPGEGVSSSEVQDYSMIVKAYTADLNTVKVVPERNWRGTAPRIYFKPPAGSPPRTLTLNGLEGKERVLVRAYARTASGYGPPSEALAVFPVSTAPGPPNSVLLA